MAVYPYLVARGKFENEIVKYDNMGAAEFEFGGIPDSYKRFFAAGRQERVVTISAANAEQFQVYVVASAATNLDEYVHCIQAFADNTIELKSASCFDRAVRAAAGIHVEEKGKDFEVWHDIECDVWFTFASNKDKLDEVLRFLGPAYENNLLRVIYPNKTF